MEQKKTEFENENEKKNRRACALWEFDQRFYSYSAIDNNK